MRLVGNEYEILVSSRITGYALSQTALRKSGPSGSWLCAVCDKASCHWAESSVASTDGRSTERPVSGPSRRYVRLRRPDCAERVFPAGAQRWWLSCLVATPDRIG